MIKKCTILPFIVTCTTLVLLASCTNDTSPTSNSSVSQIKEYGAGVICEIPAGNGKIEFIETGTNEIVVFGEFPDDGDPLPDLGGTPASIYEKYTGTPAPAALVQACQKFYNGSIDPDTGTGSNTLEAQTDITHQRLAKTMMDGNTFANNHYYNDAEVQEMAYRGLFLSRTGSCAYQRNCLTMGMTIHPYRGSVTFTGKTKYNGAFETTVTKTCTQGSVYKVIFGGTWRERRTDVTNATGDGYHYAVFGNSPLITTRWAQLGRYDDMVPATIQDKRLGCWSVAVAQLMRFHERQTTGRVNYTCTNNITISENLGNHIFNWNLIPRSIDNSSPQTEIDETSLYCYYAACVVQKDFETGRYKISGVEAVEAELESHYGVSASTYSTNSYTLSQLESYIKTEIQARRPVWLYLELTNELTDSGSAHAVVIDQYEGSGENFKMHLNCGWEGTCDGMYSLKSGDFIGSGMHFSWNQNQYKCIVTVKNKKTHHLYIYQLHSRCA